jgi:hypothetical protein
MNTIEKEPKQEAGTTADLIKQKPQEEVLKLKSSTVSSDEGKLAAGIATIGLRTKKISGCTISLKGCGASGANADGP